MPGEGDGSRIIPRSPELDTQPLAPIVQGTGPSRDNPAIGIMPQVMDARAAVPASGFQLGAPQHAGEKLFDRHKGVSSTTLLMPKQWAVGLSGSACPSARFQVLAQDRYDAGC